MNEFIEKALAQGCQEAETFQISSQRAGLFFTNNRISDLQSKESTGIALRLRKDDRLGFVGSSSLHNVTEIVDKAVLGSRYGEEITYSFASPALPPAINLVNEELRNIPIETFIPRCERFIDLILSASDNIMLDCSFEKVFRTIRVMNSNGLDLTYDATLLTFYTEMRLTDENTSMEVEMQFQSHDSSIDEMGFAQRLVADLPHMFTLRSITPGKKRVIFTPTCLGDLFFALEEGFRGSSVVKGISPFKDKLGQKVFDERVTIVDDSLDPRGKLAAPFDDEGTPAKKTYLVRNGVLESYIADLKTASNLGCEPTGNGLRSKGIYRVKSHSVKPVCDFSNVILNPGRMSLNDMISSIDDGVLVESIGGLLLANLTNGDYSGTIAHGLKIEKGKIVGRVTNAMISGNIYKDLRENIVDFSDTCQAIGGFSGQIGAFVMPYLMLKECMISSR